MGDAAFGTDPVPYTYPDVDQSPGASNNGDNIHIIERDPVTGIWSQSAELNLGQIPAGEILDDFETHMTIAGGHPSGNGLERSRVAADAFACWVSAVWVKG